MTYFIFCIHNHQPAGNFGYVLEHAYDKAYEPMLKRLFARPFLKFSFHTSGFLLDWLCEHRPAYVDMLRAMVDRGQVEIMGGGYFEPILSVIPHADRLGQIRMMGDRLEELFGVRPSGIWLAERVWDPTLPYSLKEAGVSYVVVDDYHFIKAGLKKEGLFGYYVTEDLGREVRVFPGSERLRYLIPFEPVERLEEYLKWVNGRPGDDRAVIFADDGEKFGVWPGTDRSVYEEGWLDRFFGKLEDLNGWLKPATFSQYIERKGPLGRVYLPTTSYMEMGEWALPPEASADYASLREEIKGWKDGERILRFFQGGTWRNFLAKYPEADWMHKRMLEVSGRVAASGNAGAYPAALKHLYMAQCNDAYWHGVFGGLYLPHLRANVYENLITADRLVDEAKGVTVRAFDVDADTHNEVRVGTKDLNLYFSPARGGSLVEMDWKPAAANLTNTLSRWFEGYHNRLENAGNSAGSSASGSIHDMVVAKEEGLKRHLRFDPIRRASLRDRFFKEDETLDRLARSEETELGDFRDGAYDAVLNATGLRLTRNGMCGTNLTVVKEITVKDSSSFSVHYRLESLGGVVADSKGVRFGVEFNLCLPGCGGPACHYEFPVPGSTRPGLGSKGEEAVSSVAIVDGFAGLRMSMDFDRRVVMWRYPVETVSLSEAGFERNYQGTSLVFLLPLVLPLKEPFFFSFSVRVEPLGKGA
ncbi:MAG: DUF1926 domain-containing protein [Deltaproteobacteria bacterium]|nr:DUF1926 domain-containing protein [Deltaproteobacteria bacterium]